MLIIKHRTFRGSLCLFPFMLAVGLLNQTRSQALPDYKAQITWQIGKGSLAKTGEQVASGNISTPAIKWDYYTGFLSEGYPVIGDVDNNGDNEVVCVHNRTLFVMNGTTGQLKYKKKLSYSNPAGLCPIIADVDNDFLNEIIVTTDSFITALNGIDGSVKWSNYNAPYYYISFSGPVVADLDGDGQMEVAVYLINGNLHVFRGADGTDEWMYDTQSGTPYGELAATNIDLDPALEIILCTNNGRMLAIDGLTGLPDWDINLSQNKTGFTPMITDVESDGILDIVVGNSVYFASNGALRWADTLNPYRRNACVADLDLDGIKEICYGDDSLYCISATDGARKWSVALDHKPGFYAASPVVANLYEGPELEVVCASSYDPVTNMVYLVKHDGTVIWTYQNPNHTAEGYSLADVDNDGCVEIILNPDCCFGDSTIYVIDDLFQTSGCFQTGLPDHKSQQELLITQNNNTIVLILDHTESTSGSIQLFDLNGKLIKRLSTKLKQGQNIIEFEPGFIAEGTYLIQLSSDNGKTALSGKLHYKRP